MSTICPKDGKSCIDDVCRGSGVCGITGHEMWDQCDRCHGVYSEELGVDCACDASYDENEEGEEDWDGGTFHECDATNIAVAADGRMYCAHCGWNDPHGKETQAHD